MEAARSRRLWLTLGGSVAVVALSVAAGLVVLLHGPAPTTPPPASTGGLIVQAQAGAPSSVDPQKPLRCFVNGTLVGTLTLADCAKRNGVATEALDVGVDQTGQLAAANPAVDAPAPATVQTETPSAEPSDMPQALAAVDGQGECARGAATGAWADLGQGMTLRGCVMLLFDGHCARGGPPAVGRWNDQMLRQVPGEIDISPDGHDFHMLLEQSPPDCSAAL
ncbi:MAG TPA: hypothetical protein VKU90_04025 [Caulobacteraceae bacterium]|jgi:hypothetical protein|nr:hypothetical protein [Caulobacteraceae bacterium]